MISYFLRNGGRQDSENVQGCGGTSSPIQIKRSVGRRISSDESLNCVGEGIDARILPNGALSASWKNVAQLGLAKKIVKIGGKKVEVVVLAKKKKLDRRCHLRCVC